MKTNTAPLFPVLPLIWTISWPSIGGITRDVFYLNIGKDAAAARLREGLQHAWDQRAYGPLPSPVLEFRAKLVELIDSTERNLLPRFARAAKFGLETEVMLSNDFTPPVDIQSDAFKLVERVIGETFPGLPVSPYVVTGATDACYYQDVCPSCIRFSPVIFGPEQMKGMHGLDECIDVNCLPGAVQFYVNLIRAQG